MPVFEFTRVATVRQFKQVITDTEDHAWELMDTRPWTDIKVINSEETECEELSEEQIADHPADRRGRVPLQGNRGLRKGGAMG